MVDWERIDTNMHNYEAEGKHFQFPAFIKRWICDRYDLSLGVTRAELRQGSDGEQVPGT